MLTKLPAFVYNPGQPGSEPITGGVRCTPEPPPVYPGDDAGSNGGLRIGTGEDGDYEYYDCHGGAYDEPWNPRTVCRVRRKHPAPKPSTPPSSQGRVCVVVPDQPGQVYIPPHYMPTQDIGWNAGANSERRLDGNVQLRFIMPMVAGVICGFAEDRDDVTAVERITHGFYFASAGFYEIVERGMRIRSMTPYEPMRTEFKITRVNGQVAYYVGGVRQVASRQHSTGTLSAAAALYLSGDAIP